MSHETHPAHQPRSHAEEGRLRNEVLTVMMDCGWANASFGSADGRVGRISNYREDIEGLGRIFLPQLEYRDLPIESILGHFLLRPKDGAAVEVTQYRDEREVTLVFNGLLRAYEAGQLVEPPQEP